MSRPLVALLAALTFATACLGTASCASGGPRDPFVASEARADHRRTLFIRNESGDHVAVYMGGRRIGTATAGGNCLALPDMPLSGLRITFKAVGGPTIQSEPLPFDSYPAWFVALGPYTLKTDVQGLRPLGAKCDLRRT